MTAVVPLRVTISNVKFGAPDLAARVPAIATLLNELPGPRPDGSRGQYWCARLDEPLRYHYGEDFDSTRCQPDYLDHDETGPFVWILVVVLSPRPHGTPVTPDMPTTTADLAYVIDNTLGYAPSSSRRKLSSSQRST